MSGLIEILFGTVTLAAAFRLATPVVFTAVGGAFTHKTGTFCLAFECFMLSSAFFAALGSYLTGSPIFGTLCAVAVSVLLAAAFGLFVLHLKANPLIVSIALNFGAWAMTTLLLTRVFGVRGFFHSSKIVGYSPIDIPILREVPYLSGVFNNQIAMVYLAYAAAAAGYIVMWKTPFGLRVRGVGISPDSAQSIGISVLKYRWIALLIMGALSGVGGSYLPLSGLNMFSENMSAGRGFLAFAAILVGKGDPIKITLVSILFAYTDAINLTLTSYGIPMPLLQTLPYLSVIVVLMAASARSFSGKTHFIRWPIGRKT
jgi:simple sugar transport system permease protein